MANGRGAWVGTLTEAIELDDLIADRLGALCRAHDVDDTDEHGDLRDVQALLDDLAQEGVGDAGIVHDLFDDPQASTVNHLPQDCDLTDDPAEA